MPVNIGCVDVPGGLALVFHQGFHENLKARQISTPHCKRTKTTPLHMGNCGLVIWGLQDVDVQFQWIYMSCFIFKKEKSVFIMMFWVVVFYL